MMEPFELTRRRTLQAASVFAVALAGCTGDSTGSDGSGSPATRGSRATRTTEAGPTWNAKNGPTRTSSDRSRSPASGDSEPRSPTPTRTPEETATTAPGEETDSILLPSLNVRGSPGDLVRLQPPGKVVLLDFFATWCPPCEPEMDNLRVAREQFSEDPVSIVSITRETDEGAIEQFWEDNEGTWPVVQDPGMRAFRQYGVTGLPTILVFTPAGQEVMRHNGLAGEERIVSNLERALEEV